MLSRSICWLTVLIGWTLVPPLAVRALDAKISPGSVEGQGFGQIAPSHNASIALHSITGPFYPYITGAPNTVWTYTPTPGSTLDVTATGTVREDEMGCLTVSGYIIQSSAMMAPFNLYIANVTFPCKYPACDPANPMNCMSCDPVNEGEISLAPGQTISTSIRVSNGLPGQLTVTPPSTQLQILDANGNPFMAQTLEAGEHSINIQIRASYTFTGQGDVLAKFVHTGGTSLAEDILIVKQFQPPPPSIDLEIFNGQSGPAVGDDKEETVGAFTVANLNDTDGDGKADNADANGVLLSTTGRDEVDLMKLVLHKPIPDNGGNVTLTVVAGSVTLWKEHTHITKLPLNNGSRTFPTSELDKTVWVELTAASKKLRDVKLKLTYQNGSDTVNATGIWATKTQFLNANSAITTLTTAPMNTNTGSNQITVTSPTGFAVGSHIIIYGKTPKGFDITATSGSLFTLSGSLGTAAGAGNEVRNGMSAEIDNVDMIRSFRDGGGKLGADHVSPITNNGMEMQFTVGPPGIGAEPGILFDISRQKESVSWQYDSGRWNDVSQMSSDGFTPVFPSSFPSGDEVPNDDSYRASGQRDEDNSPTNNHIYSRDLPGLDSDTATAPRRVARYNFYEFVRVKLDGGAFDNKNAEVEGSRCSAKVPWHSRMDVVRDTASGVTNGGVTTYKWMRNKASPKTENEIKDGSHTGLLTNDPR